MIAHALFHDQAGFPFNGWIIDRRINFNAVIQISRHPVGRADKDFVLMLAAVFFADI